MTDFKPETLIHFILVTRKLKECNRQQQRDVLRKLRRIFKAHDATAVLSDITISGLCHRNMHSDFSLALYSDIEAILPSDEELNIKDSIYESRLIDTLRYQVEGQQPANRKQSKLKLTILHIPTDLQFLVFHHLNFKEIISVQEVCRALCIAARNPSSLYSLHLDSKNTTEYNHHFVNECFSRPKSLAIEPLTFNQDPPCTLVGNAKWGQHVTDLCIRSCIVDVRYLGQYRNLIKCDVWCPADTRRAPNNIIMQGQIPSYHTLKDLSLRTTLTEDVMEEISKFQNLEKLSLVHLHTLNSRERAEMAAEEYAVLRDPIIPISWTNLSEFSFEAWNVSTPVFQRILMGSHPETVNIDASHVLPHFSKWIFTESDKAVRAFQAIRYFNVRDSRRARFISEVLPLLQRARTGTTPFLEECSFFAFTENGVWSDQLRSIIALFQCAKRSKLKLRAISTTGATGSNLNDCRMKGTVDGILNAPFGAFTEIGVDMTFEVLLSKDDDGWYVAQACHDLATKEESESDQEVVGNVIMRGFDAAENWMRPWLVFDGNNMKQIGLQALDIRCQFTVAEHHRIEQDPEGIEWFWRSTGAWSDEVGLCWDRYAAVLEEMMSDWMRQRAESWTDIDPRCTAQVNEQEKEYTVTLTLRA